ncbi:hypothetical protein Q7P37_001178 [Cladosporium fusiforme]
MQAKAPAVRFVMADRPREGATMICIGRITGRRTPFFAGASAGPGSRRRFRAALGAAISGRINANRRQGCVQGICRNGQGAWACGTAGGWHDRDGHVRCGRAWKASWACEWWARCFEYGATFAKEDPTAVGQRQFGIWMRWAIELCELWWTGGATGEAFGAEVASWVGVWDGADGKWEGRGLRAALAAALLPLPLFHLLLATPGCPHRSTPSASIPWRLSVHPSQLRDRLLPLVGPLHVFLVARPLLQAQSERVLDPTGPQCAGQTGCLSLDESSHPDPAINSLFALPPDLRTSRRMRTVSTLCASGAGIGVSVLGFSLAADDHELPPSDQSQHVAYTPRPDHEMTATATATYTAPIADHYTFSFNPPDRFPPRPTDHFGRSHSENAAKVIKNSISKSRGNTIMADDVLLQADGSESSRSSTPNTQSQKWLRRLSSSISKSRDSSRPPTSRPSSASVSYSNGSLAFSHTGSTTPMLPASASATLPRNKLVKRSASVRTVHSSPYQSSGSRLPLPTFKRPATSHQRSATLQELPSPAMFDSRMFGSDISANSRDPQWRHYFTPKVSRVDDSSPRRLSVSGIPNPIKRIYPDRRYTPTLVSARQHIKQGNVEADDELLLVNDPIAPSTADSSVASSPMLSQSINSEGTFSSRRSFSFSNMLSSGPSPLSRASSSATHDRLSRTTSQRVGSAPQSSMGTSFSSSRRTSVRLSKRRNVSKPESLSHSTSDTTQGSDADPAHEIQLNLKDEGSADAFTGDVLSGESQPSQQRRMPSATQSSSANRLSRLSAANSEIASTLGSDAENRSIGDASTDYQSDAFDSFPTRATTTTRSSSGKRGPPIETIFDESPPTFSSGRSTKLRDYLNTPATEASERYRYSTIEEEESITTPKRSLAGKSPTPSPLTRGASRNVFASSPPVMREMPEFDDIDWDTPEEEPTSSPPSVAHPVLEIPQESPLQGERRLPIRLAPPNKLGKSASATSTPRRSGIGQDRATIFDWAEIQPSPSHNNSPPRPKTVHGKKDPENRGSRPPGRRIPSGMHARSHSVPVVPDIGGIRNSSVANKFGTWGVGSKGVTEDWNEDFDFEDALPELPMAVIEDKRIDSGHAMFIPKAIQEQQQNVVANIGLLREWGLLIEELKDLRIRAAALGMLAGPHAETWSEVEAMIELADQESKESTLEPRRSPPSSPGFDDSAFDEPFRDALQSARARARSARTSQITGTGNEDQDDVLDEPQTPQRTITTRPRKDSEAVARSVIEALQAKRAVSDSASVQAEKPAKKVPFDTATLRHIVPYVSSVKRKIKEALREAEGLYTSPGRPLDMQDKLEDDFDFSDDEPSFRSIFTDPRSESTPDNRQARRNMAITDNDESEAGQVFGTFG